MKNKKIFGFFLILWTIASSPTLQAQLDWHRPYLQQMTQTSAIILWQNYSPTFIQYGETRKVDQVATVDHSQIPHRVQLTNLKPNTRYYYRQVPKHFLDFEETYTFKTAPPKHENYFSFMVFGDSGRGSLAQFRVAEQMEKQHVDFVIHTGDLIYSAGEKEEYFWKFFFPYRNLLPHIPFFPCLGNHDIKTDNGQPYLDVFELPKNNPLQTERFYFFEWGDALFIALDPTSSEITLESSQYEWLKTTLEQATHTWKFVYFHYPLYTSHPNGSHIELRKILMPLFEKHKVDVVFNGHAHLYERTKPISEFLNAHPVIYIVSGGGGGKIKPEDTLGPLQPFTEKRFPTYHFILVDIEGMTLHLKAIDQEGNTIDQFNLTK